ncbi:hypothetical protein PVAP13_5NG166162, partial [Panicum virgatum]
CRRKWVSQLIDSESWTWKESLLTRYLYQHDVEIIKRIQIPSRPSEDFVAWHHEKSRYFTVRSAYRLAVSLRDVESDSHPDGNWPIWKKFWALPIPHKVSIFAWKLIHGGTHEGKWTRTMASAEFLSSYWNSLFTIRQDVGDTIKGKRPILETCARPMVKLPAIWEAWSAPDVGWVKINVDGAYMEDSGEAGIGVIIRDSSGQVLLTAWKHI